MTERVLDLGVARFTVANAEDAAIGFGLEFPAGTKSFVVLTMSECEELEDALRKARAQARMASARAETTA